MSWQTIGARFKSDEIEKLDKWIKGESRNKVLREIVLTAIESGLSYNEVLTSIKKFPKLTSLSNEEQRLVERILRLREEEAKLIKSINELRGFENGVVRKIIKDFVTTPTPSLSIFTPVTAPKEKVMQTSAQVLAHPEVEGEEKEEVVKKNHLRIASAIFKKR